MHDKGRDLPRDVYELGLPEAALGRVQEVLREAGVEVPDGLWVTVHDDRDRAIGEGKRELGTGAAALAQRLLKSADELMRMAGNAQHNSPNGFDRVAEGVLRKVDAELVAAMRDSLRLRELCAEWVDRGGWREQMAADRARIDAVDRGRAAG